MSIILLLKMRATHYSIKIREQNRRTGLKVRLGFKFQIRTLLIRSFNFSVPYFLPLKNEGL